MNKYAMLKAERQGRKRKCEEPPLKRIEYANGLTE